MATGEPQYWSFICPGQCDKVVMLFCPLTVFHHFCLFESYLVVASKAKKKDAMIDRPVHTVPVHTTDTISLNV